MVFPSEIPFAIQDTCNLHERSRLVSRKQWESVIRATCIDNAPDHLIDQHACIIFDSRHDLLLSASYKRL